LGDIARDKEQTVHPKKTVANGQGAAFEIGLAPNAMPATAMTLLRPAPIDLHFSLDKPQ
jgi:hypothetical protein